MARRPLDADPTASPGPWPDHSVYGWRARLGLIVPPTNTTNEAEWSRVLPDGVTLHVTRMPLHLHVEEPLRDDDPLARDLVAAAGLLAQAGVSAIAYGCTAGSMIEPLDQLPPVDQLVVELPFQVVSAESAFANCWNKRANKTAAAITV